MSKLLVSFAHPAPGFQEFVDRKALMKDYMGVGVAIGVGIGTALGVALHNIPVWVAIGVAIGVCIGLLMNRRNRNLN
ncbi:MAG: hypothetical protein ACYDC6_00775 [Acidobacteriaceae bacterium]